MKIDQVIAENLSALMTRFPDLGSQKLLHKRSGVTTSTVGRIRRGEVSPTAQVIDSLATAFGISASDLLDPLLAKRLGAPDAQWERVQRVVSYLREGSVDERQLRAVEAILELS